MNFEKPSVPEQGSKVDEEFEELIKDKPRNGVDSIIEDIKWYIDYRELDKEASENRSDYSKSEAATDKILENQDLFDILNDKYGWTPSDPKAKWTIEELEDLQKKLKKYLGSMKK